MKYVILLRTFQDDLVHESIHTIVQVYILEPSVLLFNLQLVRFVKMLYERFWFPF